MTEKENNYLNNSVDENPEDEQNQNNLSFEEIQRLFNSNSGNKLQMRFHGGDNGSSEERLSFVENLLSNCDKD